LEKKLEIENSLRENKKIKKTPKNRVKEMTKKRSSEILDDRRTCFKIFQRFRIESGLKINFPQIFAPQYLTSIGVGLF